MFEALRQRSYFAYGNGARVRYSLDVNVNTPFFQGPKPEFGCGARVQGRVLLLRQRSGRQVPVGTSVFFFSGYSRFEHNNILCRYLGTGSRALSVNIPLNYHMNTVLELAV